MIRLKSDIVRPPRRRRRGLWLVLLSILAIVGAVGAERWRGAVGLRHWKRDMAAKGEIFEPRALWPAPSARAVAFSNQLAVVLGGLPTSLNRFSGQLSGIVTDPSGACRRGSQEPQPPLPRTETAPASWQDLDGAVRQAQPALRAIRQLMTDPPSGVGYDIAPRLEDDVIPNFVGLRRGAQALQSATIDALHCRDLQGALDNLTALAGFQKLYAQDPTLVSFMIRIAILGLTVDLSWDALASEGWTEPQLAAFQDAFRQNTLGLEQMSRTVEAERVMRLHNLDWFGSHSYAAWAARYREFLQGFNLNTPDSSSAPVRLWREGVFHPLWSFAWADQEKLFYLQVAQKELTTLRDTSRHRSWTRLERELTATRDSYAPPPAAWRFYIQLPYVDRLSEVVGGSNAPAYPLPVFHRAWLVTLKNLTLREMVSTSIALKRYQLHHGRLPEKLTGLVPEFLPEPPTDFMVGQPLRYHPNADGSFALYSVAEDGVDNGGNARPAAPPTGPRRNDPWSGQDWVWPAVVRATQTALR